MQTVANGDHNNTTEDSYLALSGLMEGRPSVPRPTTDLRATNIVGKLSSNEMLRDSFENVKRLKQGVELCLSCRRHNTRQSRNWHGFRRKTSRSQSRISPLQLAFRNLAADVMQLLTPKSTRSSQVPIKRSKRPEQGRRCGVGAYHGSNQARKQKQCCRELARGYRRGYLCRVYL